MKKTHVNSNVDLNTLAGGAFAEKVNEALVQVGENIQNQNTEATKKEKDHHHDDFRTKQDQTAGKHADRRYYYSCRNRGGRHPDGHGNEYENRPA